MKSATVGSPNVCISWNTVLVDDDHGYFVATRWYGKPEWDSAIRVFDGDLNLVWERTGLPIGKKDTLTYVDGRLVTGSGNHWSKKYEGDAWKYVAAYSIIDGSILWKCDLSHIAYESLFNLPYFNGHFYAETTGGDYGSSKLLRIRASDGALVETLDYGRSISSCAPCVIAHGRILSGDLGEDRIVVTQIAENSEADWPGPFGHPQRNQFALTDEPDATLVPMKEIRPKGKSEPPYSPSEIVADLSIHPERTSLGNGDNWRTDMWRTIALSIMFVLITTSLSSQERRRQDARQPRQPQQAAFQQMFVLRGVEFTADQQAKVDEIRNKYVPKLEEIQKRQMGVFTEEQMQARREAFRAAREAGKEGRETREAAEAAFKLTDDQTKELATIQKERAELTAQIQSELRSLLTRELAANLAGCPSSNSALTGSRHDDVQCSAMPNLCLRGSRGRESLNAEAHGCSRSFCWP